VSLAHLIRNNTIVYNNFRDFTNDIVITTATKSTEPA